MFNALNAFEEQLTNTSVFMSVVPNVVKFLTKRGRRRNTKNTLQ